MDVAIVVELENGLGVRYMVNSATNNLQKICAHKNKDVINVLIEIH